MNMNYAFVYIIWNCFVLYMKKILPRLTKTQAPLKDVCKVVNHDYIRICATLFILYNVRVIMNYRCIGTVHCL